MFTTVNRVNIAAFLYKASVSIFTLTSIFLVTSNFPPDLIGYYYIFLSAVGVQVLFEKGMSLTTIQVISREFAGTPHSGSVTTWGLQTKGLIRKFLLWFGKAGALFGGVLFCFGTAYIAISTDDHSGVNWKLPWVLLVCTQSLLLASMPILMVREAQGFLFEVWLVRLSAEIVGFTAFSLSVYLGVGLQALSMALTAKLVCYLFFLVIRKEYAAALIDSLRANVDIQEYWDNSVALFQKRISISWLAGYASHHSVTLVLFSFFSPTLAGAYGVSWQIMQGIASVSLIPLSTKVQAMAANSALGLDRLNKVGYIRSMPIIFSAFILGQAAFFTMIWFSPAMHWSTNTKFLPLSYLIPLALISSAGVVITSQAMLVRSRLIEPYTAMSIVDCCVHIFCATMGVVLADFRVLIFGILAWQYLGALPWAFSIYQRNVKAS